MLIVDDILLLPARGLGFVFREIRRAAQEELDREGQAIRTRLAELYRMLDRREITLEACDAQERELLDRLDEIESGSPNSPDAPETEEDE